MFRPRRVFPFSQVVSRLRPPLPERNVFQVRHVKLKKPWIRAFFKKCFLYGVAFHLWSSFVLLQFDVAEDETEEALVEEANRGQEPRDTGPNSDTEGSSDSDDVFVPLGWPQVREGELYSGSDPELREFAKLSRDRKKMRSLRDELVSMTLANASRSPLMLRVLGGPLTVRGSWIVHQFPSRAPPTYSRSGLDITDHGISWTSKPMSAEVGDRLLRCARPLYVTLALRDSLLVLLKRQAARLSMTLFGQEQRQGATDSPSHQQELAHDVQSLGGLDRLSQSRSPPPSEVSREGASQDNAESRLHLSFLGAALQKLPLPSLEPGSDLFAASVVFRLRLQHYRAQESHTPHRGVFYFSGPVGLKGPKGFCRVEVKGEYDPAAAKWNRISMEVRDLNIFKQKRLGAS